MVGLATGIVALLVDLCIENAFQFRMQLNDRAVKTGAGILGQYVVFTGCCVASAALAGILVCYVEPFAGGS